MVNDYQKDRVYAWEQKIVRPLDRSKVDFSNSQAVVNYIWEKEGLAYPPVVHPLAKQNKHAIAKGCRTHLLLSDVSATNVILHELAHAMTSTIDSDNVGHGPMFVGVFMKLLEKYMNMNLLVLMATAKDMQVDFDIMAHPIFLD